MAARPKHLHRPEVCQLIRGLLVATNSTGAILRFPASWPLSSSTPTETRCSSAPPLSIPASTCRCSQGSYGSLTATAMKTSPSSGKAFRSCGASSPTGYDTSTPDSEQRRIPCLIQILIHARSPDLVGTSWVHRALAAP